MNTFGQSLKIWIESLSKGRSIFQFQKFFFKIVLLLIIWIILTNKDGSSVFLLTKIEKHYYLPQNYHDAEMYLDIETDNGYCRYYMKIYICY